MQPNKAIVGANAFAHEAGIHQHGVMMEKIDLRDHDPRIDRPDTRTSWSSASIPAAMPLSHRLKELGYELAKEDIEKAFVRFKALADLKKEIFDEDLDAIVADEIIRIPEAIKLVQMNVSSGSFAAPTATVEMEIDGK